MKTLLIALRLVTFASLVFFSDIFSSADPKLLAKLQPYVVSIKSRSVVAAYGEVSPAAGTGFIVDVKKGYIFTNAHVASSHKVIPEYLATLSTGKEISLKLIYSDPAADVAVFQGDPKDMGLKDNLIFSRDVVEVGANVLIIGKNENRHFSTQTGVVANPNEIEGGLPQHAMRISLNMQGGGSGSMVYDINSGKVIGIIFASNMATSAFAIPVSYGLDILEALNAGNEPKRFATGALLGYGTIGDMVKYYSFPQAMATDYVRNYPQSFHRALKVITILPGSPAEGVLEVGDCVLAVNDKELGPDLYTFDKTINDLGSSGKKAVLKVVRYGKMLNLEITPYNMNERQINRMIVFGGATFFEADDVMIRRSGLAGKNRVVITNARLGSGFIEKLPIFQGSNHGLICVEKLGDFDIFTLNDVAKAIPELMKTGNFTIAFRNYGIKIGYDEKIIFNQSRLLEEITIFPQDGQPDEFYFNKQTHEWVITHLAAQ